MHGSFGFSPYLMLATLALVLHAPAVAAQTAAAPAVTPTKPETKSAAVTAPAKAAATAKAKTKSPSIIALINDEPLTAYEVEQRAAFIALSTGGGGDMKGKAEARWKAITKDPKTNERFQQLLKEKNVQTREEAKALQMKYVKQLQSNMVEQLKREARSGAVAGSKTKAQEELIDEKLKLQAAKKLNALASNEEVSTFIRSIAERNKMNEDQFGKYMKGLGVDISTMRARFQAEISWREVIRRRFGSQISVTGRDVDRMVAASTGGQDDVELQLQRISLFVPPKSDQAAVGKRLGEAQTLSGQFTDCATFKALAAKVAGAKHDDLGYRKPDAVPEPTRTMLLNASDGSMLPPVVSDQSVELWAVCGRKVVSANDQKRESAESELRQKEFELLAKKHLKDLRQDASIQYR
jgi:peptidyl-prolyl cis-trans isomerase SurA